MPIWVMNIMYGLLLELGEVKRKLLGELDKSLVEQLLRVCTFIDDNFTLTLDLYLSNRVRSST